MYKHIPTFGQAFNIQSIAAANLLSLLHPFIYYSFFSFSLVIYFLGWSRADLSALLLPIYGCRAIGQYTLHRYVHTLCAYYRPPPSTHFPVHKWAHFGCNSRPMTGRKNKKKLKKLKRKRRRKKKNESCCLSLSPMTKRNESARSPSTLSDDLGCVGLNSGPGKHGQRNDEGLSPRLVGRSLIYLVYWSVFFSPTPRHGQSTGG